MCGCPGARNQTKITLVLGMLGHKYVHIYEKWSWIPTAITSFVVPGFSAKHLVDVLIGTGPAEVSNVLSLRGVIFGFAVGWMSLVRDYSVYQLFSWTYGLQSSLIVPSCSSSLLGAAVMCIAGGAAPSNDAWTAGRAIGRQHRRGINRIGRRWGLQR
ncbi:hypothetical protein DFH08DRAFT_866309 [Mycena albidolilacea]|uniref:Uncharacterized protein n=1 Tax=Mycena albidolilacea TaxID=1033008 RepID=A0AAD7A3B2_9AGAR|nr:hypothetical protein DFH08DRAFT_866309 [Mycena albidolilacea]